MPIYEFECDKCKDRKELLQLNHNDSIPLKCRCGGSYRKLISHSTFVLKGNGWYATDYAKKGKEKEGAKPSISDIKKDLKKETKKKEVSSK